MTSAVVLALWALWELRTRQPLVDLRVSRRRQVLLTNSASVVMGFSMFAMSLVSLLPIFLVFLFGQKYLVKGMATTGIK